jgi:carnitine-CoA ligase
MNDNNVSKETKDGNPLILVNIIAAHCQQPPDLDDLTFVHVDAESELACVRYFKTPQASADKTAAGWLHMGDIGYRDENGWFYFLYRKGVGIRHNCDFINPAFVEKALAEYPLVDGVFVYGVRAATASPGEKYVLSAIVANATSQVDIATLFDYCRQHLESSFIPSYLQLVEEITKTASEKPQECFLLEQFECCKDNLFTQQHLEVTTHE